ncbi:gliding motility-associated ABC transporter substrate-binding protein GldG [Algoriphagus sp.]|uniref:gliding motility-associated ABC transporter substrate-binding protein GldG n=1 Tax=Algoriphagus sp. TaxID=1872435 RepID=UPI00271C9459|nr:gliding motility-associated ABC transporter substrate-binding protein GldG [Algoriphagus sp.]MDO8965530.1 gliding motility-associated ABC transporter substrate-binding protein GldG [Algoriphagus sp.]MDP3201570.1 gliding motility-associated ABC transporter substrate-binding protein GldG [Algoriphagus sp.]
MKKSGLYTAKPYLTLLAGILILLLLGQLLRFRIDLTAEKRFSVHPATKELLESLDRPIHVDILLTGKNLPGGMRRLQKSMEETVRTFNAYSSENITVSYFDPLTVTDSLQEEFIFTLADYGINPTNVFFNQNSGQQTQLIFPGILVADDEYETGALILKGEQGMSPDQILNTSIENLEFELSNAIRKLVNPEKGAIALIIGHGELSEDDGFGIVEALDGQYEVFKVPLDQAKSIQDLSTFGTIFIVGPKLTYTDRELYLLDQYVMQGGNLVIAAEGVEVNIAEAGGNGTFSFPLENELDRLLFRYGVRINKDLIQDLNFSFIPVMGGNFGNQEQLVPLPWPFYFNAGRVNTHPITKTLDQVNYRFASSLDTVKADGVIKTPLIFGSESAKIIPAPSRVAFSDMEKAPKMEEFTLRNLPLAYLLEGEFTSLFKNRFVPEDFSKDDFKESGRGKVVVFGDGSVFQSQLSLQGKQPLLLGEDPFAQTTYANKQLLQNLVQFLSDPEGIIASRTRSLQIRPLNKVKISQQKTFWQGVNVALPVLILSLLGGIILYLRKRRYSTT